MGDAAIDDMVGKTDSFRLFVGAPVPIEWQDVLRVAIEQWQPLSVRWLQPQQWHLTFVFIGNVPLLLVRGLDQEMARVFSGFRPFPLRFDQFSGVPHRNPRMIWARFQPHPEFSQTVHLLHKRISHFLERHHRPPPPPLHHPIIPHITLARWRHPMRHPLILETVVSPPLLRVTSAHLYRSILGPAGAQYQVLASYPTSKPFLPLWH